MSHHAGDDVYGRLARARAKLTPKMVDLAAFIGAHHVQAAFMTTRELAQAARVSRATVTRFPKVLGYRGFDEFRAALQDRVSFDLSAVEHVRMLPAGDESALARLRRTIALDIESLQSLAHTIAERDLDRFIAALLDAERIAIVGVRFTSPLAWHFWYSLRKVRPNTDVFTHADSWRFDDLRLMSEGAVIVVITSARYATELVSLAAYAVRLGHRVLAITDSPLSPILPYAEVALFARSPRLDVVGSLAAPAALIDCVVAQVAVRLGDRALSRLEALEESAAAATAFVRPADA
ncbi:MAG: MurR/RpiR family transcriptional regulator [Chloroflexia bacterium]|nr:MurR/RpiR family transcriptional regulator [Chloroflexia bacterium]